MLGSIRKFSTSIYAKILLGIVIIPFVFWGMGSSFVGGNQNVIATIDKEKLSTNEFANFVSSYKKKDDKISSTEIDQLLSAYIGDKLIEMEYENYGILLSDKSLRELIRNQKEFKKNNKFSRTQYEKFLIGNNLDAVSFETNLALQEKKKQLLSLIGGGVVPSDFMINKIYNMINQKRNIQLIKLNDAFKNELNFANEKIETYYEKNKDRYVDTFKKAQLLEITPKKLNGTEEFNDLYFKKIDEIYDGIIQGKNFDSIIKDYNLTGKKNFQINSQGQDLNYNLVNEISPFIVNEIFKLTSEEPTTLIDDNSKYYIVETIDTEIVQKKISDVNVKKDIIKDLKIAKKRELMSNIISKVNQNNYNKVDFDEFIRKKSATVQKIKLQSISDTKVLSENVVKQIYSVPNKKVIVYYDIDFKNNFLIYIDSITEVSIDKQSKDYEKYLNLSKTRITSSMFNAYDDYIKSKYEIEINYKALKNVKSYFN